MNMHTVLEWVKANVFIVVFSVVMIAAPIVMYFVASGMNEAVREEVQKRGANMQQLSSINVAMPTGEQVVPTEELLAQYEQVSKMLADDAMEVQKRALEFNRKGRGVLMQGVFPEPPFELRQTVPRDFHNVLVNAYDNLVRQVNMGTPPDLESLREELEGMRSRFIAQDLKKELSAQLEPSEIERLEKLLSDARLGKYKSAAASIGMYGDVSGLFVPQWDQTHIPTPGEMFNWQWQYWVVSDVLNALAQANQGQESVAGAPVKRLIGVAVSGLPRVADPRTAGGGNAPSTPRLSGGFGDGEQQPPPDETGGEQAAAPSVAAANPSAPIPRNYTSSLAGFVSNPLFDVVTVDMQIVVEVARIPEVLDALSRYNFNTIVNLRVEHEDRFAATEQGYYYGTEPVNRLTIRMQTIWLREWTKQFMPPETRSALEIAPDTPPPPAT